MACRACRSCLERLLPRRAGPIALAQTGNPTAPAYSTWALSRRAAARPALARQTRAFHRTAPQAGAIMRFIDQLRGVPEDEMGDHVFVVMERIYRTCTDAAYYEVSDELRETGTVPTTPEGEEIGTGEGLWHVDLKLPPTFSTWAQVTMLHMYLITTRLRCLDPDTHREWQQQFVDHFFYEAELIMEVRHHIKSRAQRQKFLKELYGMWRGAMLAYDECILKADADLASAIWRNVFKGNPDTDMRDLAAVVSWMRMIMRRLDEMPDDYLERNGRAVFRWTPTAEMRHVDEPVDALKHLMGPSPAGLPAAASS